MKKIVDELFYGNLAKYYDLILKFKDTNKECSFLKNIMDKFGVKTIIDTCCGVGRIACPLENMGYNVTGFDINKDMIHVAREKGCNVGFFVGNMRNFNFGTQFDCAINMRTAMAYVYSPMELLDYFNCVYKSLRYGGIFIIEGCNPALEKNDRYTRVSEDENTKIITNRHKLIINGNRYNSFEYEIIDKKSGNTKFFEEEDAERLWNLNDINLLLQKAGFSIIETYGDFDSSKYSEDSSDRLIVLAQKDKLQFIGVGAIIFNENGELLIYERTKNSKINPNMRSIPCGTMEEGENPEECLKREMMEELNIQVFIKKFVSKKEFVYDNNEKLITYGFVCEIMQGKPTIMESDKMKNLKYINIRNIPQDFFPELIHVIEKISE